MAARRAAAAALDEARFHGWLARRLRAGAGRLPVGDDTAAIPIGGGRVALLTSDALVEGYHFLPGAPPEAVGALAASVNLSDIAAKGGRPVAFLVDLLVPPGTPEDWARGVLDGAERQLTRFGAHVVGGDTKPAARPAVIGTLMGTADGDRLAPRSGARPGDRLVTTGWVGRGGLAYDEWRRNPTSRTARAALLRVEPRVAEGAALAAGAHAMLDTSDGLADSAHLLAAASRVRVVIEEGRLPIVPGLARLSLGPAELRRRAFLGGDYELLAALPAEAVGRRAAAVRRAGGRLTEVGRVEAGRGAWLATDRATLAMPEGGWRPFRANHGRRRR